MGVSFFVATTGSLSLSGGELFVSGSGAGVTVSGSLAESGGSIALYGAGATITVSGSFAMTGGQLDVGLSTGTGPTFTATGPTTASAGINLDVGGDGTVNLPNLATLASSTGRGTSFSASGTGSTIDLPNLTSVGANDELSLMATTGGQIDLPSVASLAASLNASGTGSLIDLSSITTLNDKSTFEATTGGTIKAPNLTTLDSDFVVLDGTGATSESQWTTLTNSTLDVTTGAVTLSGVTDIDGTSLNAGVAGSMPALSGTITLPAVSEYSYAVASYGQEFQFAANNAGSAINLPALATITSSDPGEGLAVFANGGKINLSGLQTIADNGSTQFAGVVMNAEGNSAEIDLSSLTSWSDPGFGTNYNPAESNYFADGSEGDGLSATAGGTILDPNLASLNNVWVTLDGTRPPSPRASGRP